ncbi:prepilin peptidase [Jatrophihabitans telluris]|uniref:Prepilin leader peptidase/N-methyltransferase n=1 Tax=Jatrophihabitans telluris TaxID=2038343 RepID=A0ABY4R194_9ACTN|nr:A24 family peptidase [Jatrophihabitans telluris]UQX89549.1 prepilin peptidase [Jatrophihabitans telluris]
MPVVIVAVALLGLAIGSFLNVVIYRLPAGKSLSRPSSHCPVCGNPIRNRHNLPVIGWLILRGRCADCRSRISIRYPLVELTTGVLFVLVALRLNQLSLLSVLPAWLCFAAIAIALTMIDVDVHRLPDAIVLPSYPVLALLLTLGAVTHDTPWALLRMLIGGLALWLSYLLLHLAYPAGMGWGDVKLAGIVGAMLGYLSYSSLLVGAFAAFFLGSLVSVPLLVSSRASRKSRIPFGPFMLAGAFLALWLARPIADAYLHLINVT